MESSGKDRQVFVAYKGGEVSPSMLRDRLVQLCDQNGISHQKIKSLVNIDVAMFKINLTSSLEKEPLCSSYYESCLVSSYDQLPQDLKMFSSHSLVFGIQYLMYKEMMFQGTRSVSFCSVLYDRKQAGITEKKDPNVHLYYGYTKEKREMMFSNEREVLESFCDSICEMHSNTYMKNGIFIPLMG